MARVTVEDCMDQMDNLFQLVLVSAKRARQIADGAEPHVTLDGDKPTVVALREIADGFITKDILNEKPPQELELDLSEFSESFNPPGNAA